MKPTLLIIGLGNPGKQYERTRHNTGFLTVDVLASEFGTDTWKPKQKFLSEIMEARVVTVPILLVKPTTYMNRSGEAARKLVDFYKIDPMVQLIVICDDVDLKLGAVRLRSSGGPGTHNGLKSLVEQFGEAFPRLRIGIGSPALEQTSVQKSGEDLSAYVLSSPGAEDRKKIDEAVAKVPGMVKKFVLGDQL